MEVAYYLHLPTEEVVNWSITKFQVWANFIQQKKEEDNEKLKSLSLK